MIEFYGSPMSSAGRTRWMLEEVGVAYDYKRIDTRSGGTRTPEYLSMYAAGKVPVLRDGAFVLGESMAINLYLAEKYRPELLSGELTTRAQIYQWSFWSITNLQPELLTIMFDAMKPLEARQPAAAEKARVAADEMLQFVELSLAGREYLVGAQFSVADVNVGSVVNIAGACGLLTPELPLTTAWLARLRARPAFVRAARD
jgi:glutathione S-transferase